MKLRIGTYSHFIFLLILISAVAYLPAFSQVSLSTNAISSPLCAGAPISISYTMLGTPVAGNVFTAQLSNSAGSFTNPTNIGFLNGVVANPINAIIPLSTPAGTGYRIRVVSSNPAPTSSLNNGANLIINSAVFPKLSIAASVNTQNVCSNTSVTFTATPTNGGAAPVYQWKVNGLNVGVNSTTFTRATWTNGDVVECTMLSNATCAYPGTIWSNQLVITLQNNVANTWQQKSDFQYNRPDGPTSRTGAVAFSIGDKAYVGTGTDLTGRKNDFWEFDPVNGLWTQKANFGGVAREEATGFSIGNKGYVGTGFDGTSRLSDFWEYNPVTNAWTVRAAFGGGIRSDATGFSIANKGYLGTGFDGTNRRNDFYEYDPNTNVWILRATFPGTARSGAVSFCIEDLGYLGTGFDATGVNRNDFWRFNPSSNSWTQMANFGGSARTEAVGFAVANKGYIGTGFDLARLQDFWEYNPVTNTWISTSAFPGDPRTGDVGFAIGNKGYVGAGRDAVLYKNDFWEFDPSLSIWSAVNDYGGQTRLAPAAFNIGGEGYLSTGVFGNGYTQETWSYNPVTNVWTQKANFPGTARGSAVGFSIGSRGYLGTGSNTTSYFNDFWEYNPVANAWTQKANFGGTARDMAVGFSIGEKGYIGTGQDAIGNKNDFWEYDPTLNTWTQKANFGGLARRQAVGFSITGKGYIGTGFDGILRSDFWEYYPVTNTWTSKANFGGVARAAATGFSIGNKGYIGTGNTAAGNSIDFWEYDTLLNTWTQKTNFGGLARFAATGLCIGSKGYIGLGTIGGSLGRLNDFWEYNPTNNSIQTGIVSTGPYCVGQNISIPFFTNCNAFNVGNVFTVQLSDSAGNFSSPINLATVTASSSQITATIPSGIVSGADYQVRILSSSPATVGTPSSSFITIFNTISATLASSAASVNQSKCINTAITSIIYNTVGVTGVVFSGLPAGVTGIFTGDKITINGTPTVSGIFNYSAVCSGPCGSVTVSGTITVIANKTILLSSAAGTNGQTVCVNSPIINITYSTTGATGATFGGLPAGVTGSFSGNIVTISGTPVVTGTFIYSISLTGGCGTVGTTGAIFVTANSTITLLSALATTNQTVCVNTAITNITYSTAGASAVQFSGLPAGVTGSFVSNTATISGTPIETGSYAYSITNVGCGAPVVTGTITIIGATHTVSIASSVPTAFICPGTSVTFTATAINAGSTPTYQWFKNGVAVGTNSPTYTNATWTNFDSVDCRVVSATACSFLTTSFSNRIKILFENTVANSWQRVADLGSSEISGAEARKGAVSFSIGAKGYIATGDETLRQKSDLWEYDPVSNFWTQRASLPAPPRRDAVAFTIATKGYLGTGRNNTIGDLNDFWEYNPVTNTWTARANVPGTARSGAFGISIYGKGYIGLGLFSGLTGLVDFWEYNPVTNTWAAKASFPGVERAWAAGFSIGSKGYIGTGYQNGTTSLADFWEYNPFSDTWLQKNNFPGTARFGAVGTAVGNTGYLGTGQKSGFSPATMYGNDFWKYIPSTDTWTRIADLTSKGRDFATAFSVNGKLYVGAGDTLDDYLNDFWEYNPSTNIWSAETDLGSSGRIESGIGFTTDQFGFAGFGISLNASRSLNIQESSFWKFDPINNKWTPQSDIGIGIRIDAVAFSINQTGYVGLGSRFTGNRSDFWSFNSSTNSWTQISSYPGSVRTGAIAFSIGSTGYVGIGGGGAVPNEFYAYDAASNTWTARASFPGTSRVDAVGFSLLGKGYVCKGTSLSTSLNDFWEYDPIQNSWLRKADLIGVGGRFGMVAFTVGHKAYIGTGTSMTSTSINPFYEYDALTDAWTPASNFIPESESLVPTIRTVEFAVAFSVNGKGYVGTGRDYPAGISNYQRNEFWEYAPSGKSIKTGNVSTGPYCMGSALSIPYTIGCAAFNANNIFSVELSDSAGTFSNPIVIGQLSSAGSGSIACLIPSQIAPSNRYKYRVVGSSPYTVGSVSAVSIQIDTFLYPSISIQSNIPTTKICPTTSVTFTASAVDAGSAPVYQWKKNGVNVGINSSSYTNASWSQGDYIECVVTSSYFCSLPTSVWSSRIHIDIENPTANTWIQKADLGFGFSNVASVRTNSVGFSIGNKGYIGTGFSGTKRLKDFWEYDPSTNVWTQRADFAGSALRNAVGFSIGYKGYIGTGNDTLNATRSDFWEFDPAANSWTQKANVGGGPRSNAVGFSIGRKGYIGLGSNLTSLKDFWEYDPFTDSWTRKTDFAGTARSSAVGFSIGNLGYVGTGFDLNGVSQNDLWQYDPTTNIWIQKADLPGVGRRSAVGMCIGDKGYLGTGTNASNVSLSDFYEYNPITNAWQVRMTFAQVLTRSSAVCFSVGEIGYVGTGIGTLPAHGDFWSFNPIVNTWTQQANMGNDLIRSIATGFSTANKGYIVTGWQGNAQTAASLTHLYEYNPELNAWSRKANFLFPRIGMVSFGIGNKGYLGTGSNGGVYSTDFWEYNPATNTFTQKASFGGGGRSGAVGFSINDKGYIGCGFDGSGSTNDFWEYNPIANTWTQKANFGGVSRSAAVGFAIRAKGYVGTGVGSGGVYFADFWEYDPSVNSWTQKANLSGAARANATGFSIDQKGYIANGNGGVSLDFNDLWEYDPLTNTWTARANLNRVRNDAVGFSIGNKGYLGTGFVTGSSNFLGDFWEYTPTAPTVKTGAVAVGPYCPLQTITIPFTPGCASFNAGNIFSAQLSDSSGSFSSPISFPIISSSSTQINAVVPSVIASSGSYLIRVVSSNPATIGVPTSVAVTINANALLTLTSSAASLNQSLCLGTSITPITYTARGITSVTFNGLPAGVSGTFSGNSIIISGAPLVTGNFAFNIQGVGPCTSTSVNGTLLINQNNIAEISITPDVITTNVCVTSSVTFTASIVNGGTLPVYQWKKNGINVGTNSNTFTNTFWNPGDFIECTLTSNATCALPATVWSNRIMVTVDVAPYPNINRLSDIGFTQPSGPDGRQGAFSFSIGKRGYVGGGQNQQGTYLNDFWEYDPPSNTWTQRANLVSALSGSVGFTIGRKGYMGTGFNGTFHFDSFWEYDPTSNTWTNKAAFPGGLRKQAVGFAINDRGYVGTGSNGTTLFKDFWEYNPTTDTWSAKANLSGVAREKAIGFGLLGKGYISTGATATSSLADLWEYNPSSNTWASRAIFGGSARSGASAFTVGTKAYVGTGFDGVNRLKDCWMYDPGANSWTIRAVFPGTARQLGVGFSSPSKGYFVSGEDGYWPNDLWEYDTSANTWLKKQNFGGSPRQSAVGFSIGSFGYIGTGLQNGIQLNDFWEYNPLNNTWTQKADFAGSPRSAACGFSIGNKGYLGTGFDGTSRLNDFWEYNPTANSWVQRANVGGSVRRDAVGFSIGNRGYVGTGLNGVTRFNDFWEYNPQTDSWSQKANVGGGIARSSAFGFSIYNKGYIGTGTNGSIFLNDFWEYDPTNNLWTQKANYAGSPREGAAGFSIGTRGYVFGGKNTSFVFSDIWQYQQTTNAWALQSTSIGYFPRVSSVGFGIGNQGYFGTGVNGTRFFADFYELNPGFIRIKTGSVTGPICAGSNITVPFQTFCNSPILNYVAQLSDSSGTFVSPITIGTLNFATNSINALIPYDIPAGSRYRIRVVCANPEFIGTDNGTDLVINASVTPSIQIQATTSVTQICTPVPITMIATIANGGNSPTYRWRKNGIDVGSNLSTYVHSDWNVGDYVECELTSNAACALPFKVNSNRINIDLDNMPSLIGVWQQKAALGNNRPLLTGIRQNASHRMGAVTFSVGDQSFMGLGNTGSIYHVDLWSFDPFNNTWSQRANLPSAGVSGAVAFSIGSKAYVATGFDAFSHTNRTFEYDPNTNAWFGKANLPAAGRSGAFGFAMNGQGYVGSGFDGTTHLGDFWSFDPIANIWNSRSTFIGIARQGAVAFVIGNKGYVGTGSSGVRKNDFWEYDPSLNAWTSKTNFPGAAREYAVGFSLLNKGYIGAGNTGTFNNDFWAYNPASDSWNAISNMPGAGREKAFAFIASGRGYVGNGFNGTLLNDLYTYEPSTDSWSMTSNEGALHRKDAIGFALGNKGYIGTGMNALNQPMSDFWEYDYQTNAWTQKADFAGAARSGAVGFAIGQKGYVGTGFAGATYFNDFWEYNSTTNTWVQKSNLPAFGRTEAVGFGIGYRGYVGTGKNAASSFSDFWEYDPSSNAWLAKASFGGGNRSAAVGFSILNKGYVGTGLGAALTNDFWEYNPATNSWTAKSNYPGTARTEAVGFSFQSSVPNQSIGFLGTGLDGTGMIRNDFYYYNPSADSWISYGATLTYFRSNAVGFTLGSRGFIGTGFSGYLLNDFWELNPFMTRLTTGVVTPAIVCEGTTIQVPVAVSCNFSGSNSYSIELSDSIGSFSNPVVIGTGTFVSNAIVTGLIPNGTPAGQFYKIRVVTANTTIPNNSIGFESPNFITILPGNSISLSSTVGTNAQTKCINTAITNITYTTSGATGANVTGLPAGVTSNFASNTVTISGAPTASGTFNYTVMLTGGCGTIFANGTITVTANNTILLSSAVGTNAQTKCINTAITNISYSTTGATGANVTGLPAGVTGSFAANTVTISGTPTASGSFNYTVTLTGGCGTITANGTLTVNPVNAITVQPSTIEQNFCQNSTATVLTVTTVGASLSYQWFVNTVQSNIGGSAVAGAISASFIPPSTSAGTAYYYVVVSGSCGSSLNSAVSGAQVVKPTGTWLGNNNNWHDAANWCGGVPVQTSNCVIQSTSLNMPLVSSSIAFVNNLDIQSGSLVKVIGQTLKMSGSLSGTGFLQADSGTIEMNGVVAQSISGSRFSNKKVGTFIISNNQGIALSGTNDTLKIRNLLRFGASNCNLTTNGNLTILSDSLGTASVGDLTSDGVNTGVLSGNRITGNVTVERFIPNHSKAWQLLGIPTVGQTIKESWMENNVPLGNNRPRYGALITSSLGGNNAGAQALGFDLYSPNGPGMKFFNPVNNSWNGVNSSNDLINNNRGYMIFIRGDRSVTAFNQSATATTLRTTGQLKTPLNNPPGAISVSANSFESVGNPYASALDFSKVLRTGGVQDLFYLWDPLLSAGYGYGAYQTFIRSGAGYLIVPGGGSYLSGNYNIESGAAFFVRANASGSGTISINESSKVNGSNTVTRTETERRTRLYVELLADLNTVLLDGVLVEMDSIYSENIDMQDAWKLKVTNGEQISLRCDTTLLTANFTSIPSIGDTIHLHINRLRNQVYALKFKPEMMSSLTVQPILIDRYLSQEQLISLDDTSNYTFIINNEPASYQSDRFLIVFKDLAVLPSSSIVCRAKRVSITSVKIEWKVEREEDIIQYDLEKSYNGNVFSKIATILPLYNNGAQVVLSKIDSQANNSNIFYRVLAKKGNGIQSFSNTVFVTKGDYAKKLIVNPNPIQNNKINIEFHSDITERHQLILIDNTGKIIIKKILSLKSGINKLTIPTNQLSSGRYIVQIITPKDDVFNEAIIVP